MRKLGLVLGLTLGFIACSQGPREVKIALALPLTGDIASLGQGLQRAVVMALEEAQNAGRFPGIKVSVEPFDDRSDPKEAVNVANRIASDRDMVAVIGHFNSGCSIPASQVYAKAGLPMVSPGSSNPELTRQQLSPNWRWPRNVFRANTTDDAQGFFGAEFLVRNLKIKSVSIVQDKTAYGQGIAEELQKRFVQLGGKVLSFDGIQSGEKDFKALVTRVKGHRAEALFYGGTYTEGALLLRQARDAGITVPFLTGENSFDPEFVGIAGPAAEGAYVTYLGRPPELLDTARRFVDKYRLRYPGEPIKAYDHYGYEVANILLEALEKCGPDRGKIIEYLHGIRYTGVLGETSFDEKGDTLNRTITLFQVKKGVFVPGELTAPPSSVSVAPRRAHLPAKKS